MKQHGTSMVSCIRGDTAASTRDTDDRFWQGQSYRCTTQSRCILQTCLTARYRAPTMPNPNQTRTEPASKEAMLESARPIVRWPISCCRWQQSSSRSHQSPSRSVQHANVRNVFVEQRMCSFADSLWKPTVRCFL